ncbi:MAG TPA: acyl-CoA dehydrogenase [Clostridia bacterium]|nr:acyl-CoA dehydrogenase [Clostridia bacterium]
MDFKLTEEQEMIKKSAREFAETVIAPKVAAMEETDEMPEEILKGLGEYGFLGLTIPTEYGGNGLGHVARMIVLEEIGRVSAAVAMTLQVLALGIEPIVQFGTEEQKNKYLPGLAKGELFSTVAVTEASGGSDPTAAQTRAHKEGDEWVINGRKVFITNAHLADVATVFARTADEPKPSFSCFLLEKGMEGFRPGRKEHKVGFKGCDTGDLIMENCRVPESQMLGKEGDGLKIALKAISEVGRPGMTGCALGILAASLEAAVKFANERILYGKPISKLQAIQFKIANMYTDLEAARLLAWRAAALKDRGERCDVEMAMAKVFSSEAAVRAANAAVEIHGGYGCMMEYPTQRYLRDASLLAPSAGTSDIMRIVIARAALG